MKRRIFIQNITWLAGGLVTACRVPAETFEPGQKIKGQVTSNGKGLKDVVVSDGYSVILTDSKGKYEIEPHASATNIFISTPPGHAFKNDNGISRHYYSLKQISNRKKVDFDLVPLDRDDNEHQFIIWADPQVKNQQDVEKMMNESVPDVQKWVAAAGTGALLHGITVGDIVWDELHLFNDYSKAVAKMNIPFFQCLGNHDMDYNKGGDETSDQSFQQAFGPTHYSFNRGKVHYVVMDDVRYLGRNREYDGFFSQNQLNWLQKDLSFVPKDRLIVLCVHIPVHNGVKNNDALYALLEGRNVHIMSGHTHYHRNVVNGNIFEHNHGTVCGAWWTGPICGDGTPCGYGVYTVNGTDLSWQYKATGQPEDHQAKIFIEEVNGERQLHVNIWNHDPEWKTEYWIDGVNKGALEQFNGFDPQAYASLLGPDLPNPRGFAEPRKTEHMFKGILPANAKEIKVIATDRFGKKYTAIHKV